MEYDVLNFIKSCIKHRRIYWTYHVNMRLKERSISREAILHSVDAYEIIEAYPKDKYLPRHLIFAQYKNQVIHIHIATDTENNNVRIITAYKPTEEIMMKCHICGGKLEQITTDLPFKIGMNTIVIIKNLPVLQCKNCSEYSIEDKVMEKIDIILNEIDKTTELEVLNYAVQP